VPANRSTQPAVASLPICFAWLTQQRLPCAPGCSTPTRSDLAPLWYTHAHTHTHTQPSTVHAVVDASHASSPFRSAVREMPPESEPRDAPLVWPPQPSPSPSPSSIQSPFLPPRLNGPSCAFFFADTRRDADGACLLVPVVYPPTLYRENKAHRFSKRSSTHDQGSEESVIF